MKTLIKQLSGGWIFLVLVLVAYGAASLVDLSITLEALTFFWKIFQQVIPLLIFIFILTKNEILSHKISVILRKLNDQSINLAVSNEIIWIGYFKNVY